MSWAAPCVFFELKQNLCLSEHIRTGTVPKAVDAMLSIKPIVTPLTKE